MNTLVIRNARDFDASVTAITLNNGVTLIPVLAVSGLFVTPAIQLDAPSYRAFISNPEDTLTIPEGDSQRDAFLHAAVALAKIHTAEYADEANGLLLRELVSKS